MAATERYASHGIRQPGGAPNAMRGGNNDGAGYDDGRAAGGHPGAADRDGGGARRAGMPREHAVQTADVLLDAELRGYDDHGVFFLGEIYKWFKAGALNPAPTIRVVQETDSSLLLDGDKGCAV